MTKTLIRELQNMQRPKLLMQAAKIGAQALAKAGRQRPAGLQGTVSKLLSEEADLNAQRRDGAAEYSPRRHVDLLMTLLVAASPAQSA